MSEQVNVLMVDDQPENLVALEAMLEPLGQNLISARSGRDALRALLTVDAAVVLLDVRMPDMDGFETAELIRSRERTRDTPIIWLISRWVTRILREASDCRCSCSSTLARRA